MDHDVPIDESALTAGQTGAPTPAVSADDLSWAVVAMRAGERIVVNAALIAAYQAASSPPSLRAHRSDLAAFDLWCRRPNRLALTASDRKRVVEGKSRSVREDIGGRRRIKKKK